MAQLSLRTVALWGCRKCGKRILIGECECKSTAAMRPRAMRQDYFIWDTDWGLTW